MANDKKSYSERQLVIFNIGSEEFGVDINEVREIIKYESITKIPNTADYIMGAINLRGSIITVINLALKLSLPVTAIDKDTRIIVIEVGSNIIGMIVDSATEVMRLRTDQIQPTPEIINEKVKGKIHSDFIEGIGTLKDRMIILLDLTKVIETKEIEKVQAQAKTV